MQRLLKAVQVDVGRAPGAPPECPTAHGLRQLLAHPFSLGFSGETNTVGTSSLRGRQQRVAGVMCRRHGQGAVTTGWDRGRLNGQF